MTPPTASQPGSRSALSSGGLGRLGGPESLLTHLLPVGLLCALLIALMAYGFERSHNLMRTYPPQMSALQMVVSETVEAHLWAEEFLSGDPYIMPQAIPESFAHIRAHLELLLAGGSMHQQMVRPLDRQEDITALKKLQARLDSLEALYTLRANKKPLVAGIGSPEDQRFDQAFLDFLQGVRGMQGNLRSRSVAAQHRLHRDKLLILAFAVAASLAFLARVKRYAVFRRQTFFELEAARLRAEADHKWLVTTLECMGDGVLICGPQGQLTYMNPRAEAMSGWDVTEALGRPLRDVFDIRSDKFPENSEQFLEHILARRQVVGLANSTVLHTKNGREMPIADSGAPILNSQDELLGGVIVFQDMTQRHEAKQQLETSLREKDVLLREVHHRVKNNMQVIISLLDLQQRELTNAQDASRIKDIQNHILSMALVHEKLYTSQDLSRVDFGRYLQGLVKLLPNSLGVDTRRVELVQEIADVDLPLDTAVPCGMLVNELVTNALKHAYPEGRTGTVSISLLLDGPGHALLRVRDNGVGLPQGVDPSESNGFGLRLVRTLARQMRAEISYDDSLGLSWRLRIPTTPPRG